MLGKLQEMKAVTKSNLGLGVHLEPLKICETKTNSWEVKWGGKFFKLELWRLAKYYINNMPSEVRQKNGETILFNAKGTKKGSP